MLRGYRKNGKKSREKSESVKEYYGLEISPDGQVKIALNPDMLTEMIDITEAVKNLGQTAMLAIMTGVMESEVNRLAGDRYERRRERENYRWSNERGSVRCMGQKVGIERPRVRSKAGTEIPIKSYELFQSKDENANTVMERVLSGLSNRKYKRVVESVIDGSKALSKAIKKVFGENALIQRCQIHKRRNVKSHLPEKYHVELEKRLRVAYGMKNYSEAKELLEQTVNWLAGMSPSPRIVCAKD